MKIVKKDLLAAIKRIRAEYVKETHETRINTCGLCILYYGKDENSSDCALCPMSIFSVDNLGCLNRKVRAAGSMYLLRFNPERKAALVELYDKFIERVKKTSEADLNLPNAFDFLLEMDNEVYDKYRDVIRIGGYL